MRYLEFSKSDSRFVINDLENLYTNFYMKFDGFKYMYSYLVLGVIYSF